MTAVQHRPDDARGHLSDEIEQQLPPVGRMPATGASAAARARAPTDLQSSTSNVNGADVGGTRTPDGMPRE